MEKYLPLLGLGIVLVVLASGCTQSQGGCLPPYIIKGGQCCMDQNNNAICDIDEAGWNGSDVTPPVQKNYTSYEVKMYVQDVYPESGFWKRLPASPPKNYDVYQLYNYEANQSYYDGGWLYLYTRYKEEIVVCLVKEYRDSVFYDQNVVRLDMRPETEDYYGASVQVLFLKEDAPRLVRYEADCRGSDSGITFKDAYAVGIVAP